jgi:membrane-associated phospholipid phosphatase
MHSSARRAAILVVAASAVGAQTTPTSKPPLFTPADAIWSAVFLGGSIALSTADVRITHSMLAHHDSTLNSIAHNFGRLQEGTWTFGNLALYGIGRLAHMPTLADVTIHATEAVAVASVASQLIRGPLGRSRPYDTQYDDQYAFHWFQGFTKKKYRAFPSIHTASAFAAATVYTLETQHRAPRLVWVVAPVAYVIAAGPGLARLYDGQHWASDILSGAFVGVLAGAKVVRYNHTVNPHNKLNRFLLGDQNIQTALGGNGVSFSFEF